MHVSIDEFPRSRPDNSALIRSISDAYGSMFYPNDAASAGQFSFLVVDDWNRAGKPNELPDGSELSKSVMLHTGKKSTQGIAAAFVAESHLKLSRSLSEVTLNKACFLASDWAVDIGTRKVDFFGTSRTISVTCDRKTLARYFNRYRSCAHYWMVTIDFERFTQEDFFTSAWRWLVSAEAVRLELLGGKGIDARSWNMTQYPFDVSGACFGLGFSHDETLKTRERLLSYRAP